MNQLVRLRYFAGLTFSLAIAGQSSWAQITVVQSPAASCTNASSCTVVFPSAVLAGDSIFIATDFSGASLSSALDSLNNHYTVLGTPLTSPDSSWQQVAVWTQSTASGSFWVAMNLTEQSPFMEIYAFDIRGGTLDTSASATGAAGTISAPIPASLAGETVVAVVISGSTAKVGAGFTVGSNLDDNLSEWRLLPSAGVSSVTGTSNADWTMNAATFKPTAVMVAPSITTQPASQAVNAGQTATFSVVATGAAPLSYQWQKNGTAISGATAASYTTPATSASDNGSTFLVVVSNAVGNVASAVATLTVNMAPSITTQPASQAVNAGRTATFSVVATGAVPLSYQWQKNGTAISGATAASYTTPASSASDNGSTFLVVVSNAVGNVTSNSATLTVNSAPSIASATINAATPGIAVPSSFGGISMYDIQDTIDLIGTATAPNLIYRQLIGNLIFTNQQFIFTTEDDQGESTAPSALQVGALGQLYVDLNNRGVATGIYAGVPMCPNSVTLATSYASAWIAYMPAGSMLGMVLGNEPDGVCRILYPTFLSDFQTWASKINSLPGGANLKFMGPQFGGQLPWQYAGSDLNPFINSEHGVLSVVGQHWYPLNGCGGSPTLSQLLATSAATSASSILSPYVTAAHSYGLPFRVSEMNSVDCSGISGISDTFASALWVMDGMFHLASVGVDGVNIFSDEGDSFDLFYFTTTSAPYHISSIAPEYYGVLVFQQATQDGAKLLPVTLTTSSNISVWATIDASNTVRVLVINKDQSASGNVSVTLTGFGNGTLSKLVAPSVSSKTGVTWAGQTFDGSTDGTIQGTASTTTVVPVANVYTFSITPTSAALLTIAP
jgi:hypothetical protein